MAEISKQELDERIAILKRFRTLLMQQREKFREYLTVLEKQQDSIASENTEALLAHTELEQQVVKSIASMQKVIVPMAEMYTHVQQSVSPQEAATVESVQKELTSIQAKVLAQNEKNRNLLRVHIAQIQQQMKQLRNPYHGNKSVYAQKHAVGALVEVNA
ncbi:MAG: flagellar biosynthesis protein FlgN [Treponema sp.]|nr:flagellar biosynthesis protein FlgN [Treponema sp.]